MCARAGNKETIKKRNQWNVLIPSSVGSFPPKTLKAFIPQYKDPSQDQDFIYYGPLGSATSFQHQLHLDDPYVCYPQVDNDSPGSSGKKEVLQNEFQLVPFLAGHSLSSLEQNELMALGLCTPLTLH